MVEESKSARDLLLEHRKSIDRLDSILVYALAERFTHTKLVGKLKAENKMPPADISREKEQISRLHRLAEEADLDPEFARKMLKFIIDEVIQHHRNYQVSVQMNASETPSKGEN
ncbi:MAG: chorismate mutase [Roseovarius sp.]|nr:chorismate mutase [Roseovarius sp.]MCY4290771.1 chorismate mutase [Roseovarius sp.]MCY4315713.1 chorismate mutase [Roseovarius sp.]